MWREKIKNNSKIGTLRSAPAPACVEILYFPKISISTTTEVQGFKPGTYFLEKKERGIITECKVLLLYIYILERRPFSSYRISSSMFGIFDRQGGNDEKVGGKQGKKVLTTLTLTFWKSPKVWSTLP
jgi:hypothetical protein